MTKKEELKTFFGTEKESRKWIEGYEKNIIFFNHLLKNGHNEDVEFVIPIKITTMLFLCKRKDIIKKPILLQMR